MANKSDKTEEKNILPEDKVAKLIFWLQSKEGNAKIIEVQKENSELKRMIREMNDYDPALMLRPYTI